MRRGRDSDFTARGQVTIPVIGVGSGTISSERPMVGVCFARDIGIFTIKGQMQAIKFGAAEMSVRWNYKETYQENAKEKMAAYQARRLASLLEQDIIDGIKAVGQSANDAFASFDTGVNQPMVHSIFASVGSCSLAVSGAQATLA